jgi:GNAT superfamily N-acetyltransferase
MTGPSLKDYQITGYYPGLIGLITHAHARYYHENWQFDKRFEIQVAGELASFIGSMSPDRDGIWAGAVKESFIGSIAMEANTMDIGAARLRWFIVNPDHQGRGVGADLISKALTFAGAAGFKKVYLWTFKGLESARALYERNGFKLTEENEARPWGPVIIEQKYELEL